MKDVTGNKNPNYKGGAVDLICSYCGKFFIKSRGAYNYAVSHNRNDKFFCSRACSDKGRTNKKEQLSTSILICEECGNSHKTYLSQRRHKHSFCSKRCAHKFNSRAKTLERIKTTCTYCGSDIIKKPVNYRSSVNHFCNPECFHKFSVKENNPQWKGGITSLPIVLKNIKEYVAWKKEVYTRDNYECCKCGSSDNIHAHHKIKFSVLLKQYNITSVEKARITKELWDVANGMTLCNLCHIEEHPEKRNWMITNLKIAV